MMLAIEGKEEKAEKSGQKVGLGTGKAPTADIARCTEVGLEDARNFTIG
jgi:hypothetical protein